MTRIIQGPSIGLFCVLLAAACGGAGSSPESSAPANQAAAPVDASLFTGQWYRQAGNLSIYADGRVVLAYQVQRVPTSPLSAQLKLQITSVSLDTAIAKVTASNEPEAPIGSEFMFYRTDPGILVSSPAGESLPWCDLVHKKRGECAT